MDLELRGKAALVTGGSRGIGKAVAHALAAEGVSVAIAGRDRAHAETTARELAAATGATIIAVTGDTGDDEQVKRMVADAASRLGRLDILVNSAAQPAGQGAVPPPDQVTAEQLNLHMNVKVMGYLRCAREALPHMRRRSWGRIINISGLGARRTGDAVGTIRNVAVVALTKNLADQLAGTGITVTCVHPGLTRTEKVDAMIAARARSEGITDAAMEAKMASGTLLGRLPTSEDVAAIVTFLASPRSVAINGDVIAAGGGSKGTINY
jgi:NAD(P)-dependent dehydrogenase (short-subunit alcohol dehydrogenase family)